MGKKSKSGKNLESAGILIFCYQYRVPLIGVTLMALVISVVVSLLITPRYRSAVVLYPTPLTNVSRSLLSPLYARTNLMAFGEESDAERLLQILRSESIRERMVEKYNLMEHYQINKESGYPRTALSRKYIRNVRFRKTEYRAIEIEVLDTDPVIAAGMANDIAGYLDSVMNSTFKDRAMLALDIVGDEYGRLKDEVNIMQDSLRKIREMGIVDYESQAEVLNEAMATSVLIGDTASINYFRERINILAHYGGIYVSLRDNLVHMNVKLIEMKSAYDEARVNTEKTLPYKFVIEYAKEPDKKAYPLRSLIVVVSTFSAFLFTLFVLILSDAFKRKVFINQDKKKK